MSTDKKIQFGELSPSYNFVLNPYPDERLSRCPYCGQKTGQRKLPLVIHVDPLHLIALNYTCRYCHACDLLMAHKHEVEHLLAQLFQKIAPEDIGNDYLIIGTMEKKAWRENAKHPLAFAETLAHISDFVAYYEELRMQQQGWFLADQEPPVREPPPSQEWVNRGPDTDAAPSSSTN